MQQYKQNKKYYNRFYNQQVTYMTWNLSFLKAF